MENHPPVAGMAERSTFASTHWSIVAAAGQEGSPEAARALASLCSVSWYPPYSYLRRKGYHRDEAQDLTQEFFARFIAALSATVAVLIVAITLTSLVLAALYCEQRDAVAKADRERTV